MCHFLSAIPRVGEAQPAPSTLMNVQKTRLYVQLRPILHVKIRTGLTVAIVMMVFTKMEKCVQVEIIDNVPTCLS